MLITDKNQVPHTDIGPHTDDASSEADHGALAARAATARPVLIARVDGAPDDVVDRLADHQRLRHAGLDVEHGARLAQESHHDGLLGVILAQPGDVAHGGFVALSPSVC